MNTKTEGSTPHQLLDAVPNGSSMRSAGIRFVSSARNRNRRLGATLPKGIPFYKALIPTDGTGASCTGMVHRTIEERLLPGCALDSSSLINAERDITLRARDGRVVRTKSIALKSMSAYFHSSFRSNWDEVARGEFETDISLPVLRTLAGFFETGNALLSLQNIQQVFIAMHYLQVDSILEPCKDYLMDNLPETVVISMHLASLYEGMEELATQAAICCAEDFHRLKSTILHLPGHFFAAVISQDVLRVDCEDEVLKLIADWRRQKLRSEREVLHVLESVRFPHLTLQGFKSVLRDFKEASKLAVVQLCLQNRYHEMPEEQLNRRTHYMDHMHLIWSETPTVPPGVRPLKKPTMRLKMTCLRCTPGRLISHKILCHIPEMRNGNHKFQFISLMNSLLFVTHSAALRDVFVYKQLQETGGWILQNKVPRVSKIEEFGVCTFRGKMILTMFAGYSESIRGIEIDTSKDSNIYRIIDFLHPGHTSVSSPQMSFHDDWLIFLAHDRVHLSNPHKEDFRRILARRPNSRRGIESLACFKSFVRCDQYLYIYKDMVAPSATFRRVRGLYDKVLKVNIDTQNVEKVLEVRSPLYSEFDSLSRSEKNGEKRIRLVFVSGSKLFVGLQEAANDVCRLAQLIDDEDQFSTLIDVKCTDPGHSYTRRLEHLVPIHIHQCGHTTHLSRFCSQLVNPDQHALLERLSFYL